MATLPQGSTNTHLWTFGPQPPAENIAPGRDLRTWTFDLPPTYAEAVSRKPWLIIGRYLLRSELATMCRVSSWFHQTYSPRLWKSPVFAAFLPKNDVCDDPISSLATFIRSLPSTALSTRSFVRTITIRVPSVGSMDAVPVTWLRTLFEWLPLLRTLLLPTAPCLDHGALRALHFANDDVNVGRPAFMNNPAGFGLVMLNISDCQNTGSKVLKNALRFLPHLKYLDVSHTSGARELEVLQAICNRATLPRLLVLKLARLQLTDSHVEHVAGGLGTRVFSLDLRSNRLTDRSVQHLLDHCFCPPDYNPDGTSRAEIFYDEGYRSNSPRMWNPHRLPTLDDDDRCDKAADEQRNCMREWEDYDVHDPVELNLAGLTHLYLSANEVTSEGFDQLLRTERLRALDCGTVLLPDDDRPKPSNLSRQEFRQVFGALSLIPALRTHGCRRALRWLRINHHLVTGAAGLRQTRPELWHGPVPEAQTSPLFHGDALYLPPWNRVIPFPSYELLLTEVPRIDKSGAVARALKLFIRLSAVAELSIAISQWHAINGQHVPPPPNLQTWPNDVYLRSLQLEHKHGDHQMGTLNAGLGSSVDDPDVRVFSDALATDFSFFAEDDRPACEAQVAKKVDKESERLIATTATNADWRAPDVHVSDSQAIRDRVLMKSVSCDEKDDVWEAVRSFDFEQDAQGTGQYPAWLGTVARGTI
ncbi:MAG: hypothetical protein M1817_001125 [Caeruleum heppii]|nr:MAG: hypothetical protein M1817_001125 [Caeruleum heppii]